MKPARKPILALVGGKVASLPPPVAIGLYARGEASFQRVQSTKMAMLEWEHEGTPKWMSWLAGAFTFVSITIIIIFALAAS